VINYNEFVTEVHRNFKEIFTIDEIRDLLDVGDFEKDNPNSLGKRLIINCLKVKGKKINGDVIDLVQHFYSGVNVIYADNNKGKSSVFKMIKFALTGDKSSIKKDVLSWLHEIFLEFTIGTVTYTIYINLTGARVKSVLYRITLDELTKNIEENNEINPIYILFTANNGKEFMSLMQEFFFNQFSYYSLKWTSGSKETINLIENQTSWKTYYKSIYLESKDYNVLFLSNDYGSQERKILEMILGLKYTYAINVLSQKRDYLKNHLLKTKYLGDVAQESVDKERRVLELEEINRRIREIQANKKEAFNKSIDIEKYNSLTRELLDVESSINELLSQKNELNKQILNIRRNINRLEEEIEFGMFFSNLEVKICPRCENLITNKRKEIEKEHRKCMLCESELNEGNEEHQAQLKHKLEELRGKLGKLEEGLKFLDLEIKKKEDRREEIRNQILTIESSIEKVNFEEDDIDLLNELIEKKIELQYQLKLDEKTDTKIDKSEEKFAVIEYAIKKLYRHRLEVSKNILESLSKLILEQLHEFGLENISNVQIDDNIDITFEQNGQFNKFTELNEGEQLRAKIAFFLGLIKLDIEYKVGRHPRILIIDSPGKEEVISKDLIGLANLFKEIEEKYENELQIIIGTALKELQGASVKEKVKIKENGEFVF
jgi:DNA repair exonuclease SbcCD ATPase subunit